MEQQWRQNSYRTYLTPKIRPTKFYTSSKQNFSTFNDVLSNRAKTETVWTGSREWLGCEFHVMGLAAEKASSRSRRGHGLALLVSDASLSVCSWSWWSLSVLVFNVKLKVLAKPLDDSIVQYTSVHQFGLESWMLISMRSRVVALQISILLTSSFESFRSPEASYRSCIRIRRCMHLSRVAIRRNQLTLGWFGGLKALKSHTVWPREEELGAVLCSVDYTIIITIIL